MIALAILGKLLLGWLIADFMTGLVHWAEDHHVTAATPLIGKAIGAPNELHHADPSAFLASGFIDRNWTTWVAAGLLAVVWLCLFGPGWVFAGALVGGLLASEVHCWAHRTDVPPVVRALQRSGLWQSRGGHARHHRSPIARDYCVLTDYLNPWLELVGFWRLLGVLTGAQRRQGSV